MKAIYERIATEIRTAEAIIVGASNGLSITEGFHLFADNLWFQTNFGDFRALRLATHSRRDVSFVCDGRRKMGILEPTGLSGQLSETGE